jgi:predicted nucleic-acid-binding protein
MCELAWVLRASFRLPKTEVAHVLQELLHKELFIVDGEEIAQRALDRYKSGPADFSDYLLGEIALLRNCRDTVTFDKALRGAPGFTLL